MLPAAPGRRAVAGEYDAGARVPALQLARLLGVVREEEVLHRVLLPRRAAGQVRISVAADALLVHSWQGKPLTREHGGPVRLVIPHLYFWKSAKWISRIEFLGADKPGFWEVNGYHRRGDPWAEERYSED